MAVLEQPVRRQMFRLLGEGWMSRDDVAAALDVSRSAAAFHLDKLVAAGLATTSYQRLSGRSGPGAGRPAKLYRRAVDELWASLPERRYDVAGSILAAAVERSVTSDRRVDECMRDEALSAGAAVGEAAAERSRRSGNGVIVDVLAEQGYEPVETQRGIDLQNCPFHRLAAEQPVAVCLMNLHFLEGVLAGCGATDEAAARLQMKHTGRCCVRIESQ